MLAPLGFPLIARYLFASNARTVAKRTRALLGWEPKAPSLWEALEQDIDDAINAMGDRGKCYNLEEISHARRTDTRASLLSVAIIALFKPQERRNVGSSTIAKAQAYLVGEPPYSSTVKSLVTTDVEKSHLRSPQLITASIPIPFACDSKSGLQSSNELPEHR